ncbi:MAG: SIMPL domain-containing protein [Rhodospirillaceae bacterium]|nr:SIMPL domain-containing protein [Rhodospirillales bacterium]MBT3907957.1 SIMPL domain-containing protein [Rhodospirillaceae bacterium]MBT5033517.1 SIMPL domain-containing protein [Rhodospirillaceae bacterium]MBT6219466.1 SIMPL domain-containing protein [Rhodospirillaceae bacterium]MBT6360992.1 SIMPL domain-containing protein [Rhodospirillaceae bacterium]
MMGLRILCIVFAFFFFATPSHAGHQDSTVTVAGVGEVRVKPDTASISVGSIATASAAVEAMARASRAMEKIIDAAGKAGVADKDLRTQTVSVSPTYKRTNNNRGQRPEISGYRAQQRLRVTVRKIAMAGEIMDTLVKAGANEVGGISFSVTERAALVDEARKKAVAAARHAADILATEAGLRLGAALKIEEVSSSPVQFRQERMMSAQSSRVPVSPGEIAVSVRVRVVFYLVNADRTK